MFFGRSSSSRSARRQFSAQAGNQHNRDYPGCILSQTWAELRLRVVTHGCRARPSRYRRLNSAAIRISNGASRLFYESDFDIGKDPIARCPRPRTRMTGHGCGVHQRTQTQHYEHGEPLRRPSGGSAPPRFVVVATQDQPDGDTEVTTVLVSRISRVRQQLRLL